MPEAQGSGEDLRIAADNPIERREDDTIGRTDLATGFADQVLAQDYGSGLVVGVLGPWGSGKTSFINLGRDRFKARAVPILDFNPWMFSGAEQLVTAFFIELAAQLKLRKNLAEIGASFEEYGESFLAWAGFRSLVPGSSVGVSLTRRLHG